MNTHRHNMNTCCDLLVVALTRNVLNKKCLV